MQALLGSGRHARLLLEHSAKVTLLGEPRDKRDVRLGIPMMKSALLPCAPKPLSGSAMYSPGVSAGIIPEKPGIGCP